MSMHLPSRTGRRGQGRGRVFRVAGGLLGLAVDERAAGGMRISVGTRNALQLDLVEYGSRYDGTPLRIRRATAVALQFEEQGNADGRPAAASERE
jgi:hypothetical protein